MKYERPGYFNQYLCHVGADKMKRMHCLKIAGLILIAFWISQTSVFAQQDVLEDRFDSENATDADVEYLEELEKLLSNPVELNSATRNQLRQIPELPIPTIDAILQYRQTEGPFTSVDDLLHVTGITPDLLQRISPFLTVERPRPGRVHQIDGDIRFRYASRDSNPDDYDSFYKLYQRGRVIYNDWLSVGVLAEKDPGESDWDDLLTWYVNTENSAWPINGVAGYYKLEFGQGLLFSPQAGVFKGGEVVTGIKKRLASVRPYTSASEVGGLLGIAGYGQMGPISAYVFGSQRDLDATLKDDGTVQSIYETGYHRTETELAKVDQLQETLYGLHTRFDWSGGNSIGVTYYQSEYDKKLNPDLEANTFYRFRGDELSAYSVDADIYAKNLNFFGEFAQSIDHGRGWVVGATLDVRPFELATVWRDYDADFYTLHGYGFADSKGNDENEQGQFVGIRWRLPRGVKMWAYFDFFQHPFRRYTTPIPDDGQEYYTQLEVPLRRGIFWTIRLKSKTKLDSYQGSDWYPKTQRNYRVQLDWEATRDTRLRIRYEHVEADSDDLNLDDAGMVMYGDVKTRPIERLQFYGRLVFYDTDSSEAPVYVFENDLPGVLTNVYLSGEGRRWYVLGKYEWRDRSYLSLKLAQKTQHQPNPDAINVPTTRRSTITEWSAQLDWRF